MIQKSKNLKVLESDCNVRIDVKHADSLIEFQGAPDRYRAVEQALAALSGAKVTLDVPMNVIPKLIGKKGEVITKCIEETGALLDIDRVVRRTFTAQWKDLYIYMHNR